MAPYPSQQQQPLHLQQGRKPAAPAYRHGHGHPQPDAVSAVSLRRGAPTDARGLRALIKGQSASNAGATAAVHGHACKLGLDRERTVRNGLIALYLSLTATAPPRGPSSTPSPEAETWFPGRPWSPATRAWVSPPRPWRCSSRC
ncbi:unnamed protein product [Urochloa humidicola]